MMTARPLAALTSSLLARKGQAKPAMRPQGFAAFGRPQDDLGWDDMGSEAPIVAPPLPPVVQQQEELAAHFQAEPIARGYKAAFTLRLDADRHLRLRLASAVKHRSSQQIVTQALDALLKTMPELEELVARAKAPPAENDHA